jgi:hypothetical protein
VRIRLIGQSVVSARQKLARKSFGKLSRALSFSERAIARGTGHRAARDRYLCAMVESGLFNVHTVVHGDGRLLAGLGEALRSRPTTWQAKAEWLQQNVNRLDLLMVAYWMPHHDFDGLCAFTAPAMTFWLQRELGNDRLTLALVTKTRQRLGLVRLAPPSVGVRIIDAKTVLHRLDKS